MSAQHCVGRVSWSDEPPASYNHQPAHTLAMFCGACSLTRREIFICLYKSALLCVGCRFKLPASPEVLSLKPASLHKLLSVLIANKRAYEFCTALHNTAYVHGTNQAASAAQCFIVRFVLIFNVCLIMKTCDVFLFLFLKTI